MLRQQRYHQFERNFFSLINVYKRKSFVPKQVAAGNNKVIEAVAEASEPINEQVVQDVINSRTEEMQIQHEEANPAEQAE